MNRATTLAISLGIIGYGIVGLSVLLIGLREVLESADAVYV